MLQITDRLKWLLCLAVHDAIGPGASLIYAKHCWKALGPFQENEIKLDKDLRSHRHTEEFKNCNQIVSARVVWWVELDHTCIGCLRQKFGRKNGKTISLILQI